MVEVPNAAAPPALALLHALWTLALQRTFVV